MHSAFCDVTSERAGRYLAQLCKHFAHKISVEWDATVGRADFAFGVCDMAVEGDRLRLTCSAASEEALAKVKYIVEDHIVRFAWREDLKVVWSPASEGPP